LGPRGFLSVKSEEEKKKCARDHQVHFPDDRIRLFREEGRQDLHPELLQGPKSAGALPIEDIS
jgi:hypothetical protein